ncbi:MAG: PIN domain-containing protein, partial [Hadesarchaea archaeon]|nr:PIN domain-containing protein [Hadesarchaea archaeon]
ERIRKKFIDWTKSGIIVLEELSKMRASDAQLIAIRHRLRGADAVVVQLAREKKCKLASFDKEILREFEKLKRQS